MLGIDSRGGPCVRPSLPVDENYTIEYDWT